MIASWRTAMIDGATLVAIASIGSFWSLSTSNVTLATPSLLLTLRIVPMRTLGASPRYLGNRPMPSDSSAQ